MEYFTKRHGMRKEIQKTSFISVDKYALLLECCEQYYDNLAWKYPEECPDGRGCCGLDVEKFQRDMSYEVPTLYRDEYNRISAPHERKNIFEDEATVDEYDQYALLDLIEFVAENCRDFARKEWHQYFGHYDLSFSSNNENTFKSFRENINEIFQKTGLLYELKENGWVERIIEIGVLNEETETIVLNIKEQGTKELMEEAILLHKSPHPDAHKEAVAKIWDAFERLKSYYATKKQEKLSSIDKIITDISGGQEYIKQLFDKEFKTLTNDIGNACHIRHSEVWQVDITDIRHYDYFFNRCLSIIALAIQYLE